MWLAVLTWKCALDGRVSILLVPEQKVYLPTLHLIHRHGLINYIDTKAKCRHLKNLTGKGTLRQVSIRVYRLEMQSVLLVFSIQLCELLPLYSNLHSGSPLSPFLVWFWTLYVYYTRIQRVRGGYGVLYLRQINTCRNVSSQVNFFRWWHFALPSACHTFLRT